MPTSNLHIAPMVLQLVRDTGAQTVLDVGPGWGKFGVLLREYAGVEHVDAVEKWAPYVKAHGLKGIYRAVVVGDVCDLPDEILAGYDVVLMSEVLEHIDRDAATELLNRIPGHVVLSTPVRWHQQAHEVPTEVHRSLWSAEDFRARADVVHENLGELIVRLGRRVD